MYTYVCSLLFVYACAAILYAYVGTAILCECVIYCVHMHVAVLYLHVCTHSCAICACICMRGSSYDFCKWQYSCVNFSTMCHLPVSHMCMQLRACTHASVFLCEVSHSHNSWPCAQGSLQAGSGDNIWCWRQKLSCCVQGQSPHPLPSLPPCPTPAPMAPCLTPPSPSPTHWT